MQFITNTEYSEDLYLKKIPSIVKTYICVCRTHGYRKKYIFLTLIAIMLNWMDLTKSQRIFLLRYTNFIYNMAEIALCFESLENDKLYLRMSNVLLNN
jgi:hypothetical protein